MYTYIILFFSATANLRTKTLDFGGFDSNIILLLRGGVPRPTGDLPEGLSQGVSVREDVTRDIGRSTAGPRTE